MNRCQRNLRLEQIKRVWRHQKNRVRHILNLENHSPGNRRLDELDLTFRKRAATSPSIRIDDSVASVLDRIAAECAVEANSQGQSEQQFSSPMSTVKEEPTQSMDQSLQECNNLLEIQRVS
ncbi:hypothetical protein OSTOST_21596 [Ostertagia ostertagi]